MFGGFTSLFIIYVAYLLIFAAFKVTKYTVACLETKLANRTILQRKCHYGAARRPCGVPQRYAWKLQDTAGLHRKTAGHINNNRKTIFRRENK